MLEAGSADAEPASEAPPRLRFPALDPEPPPSPWRIARRVLVLVVVLAIGFGGYTAVSRLGGRTGRAPSASQPASVSAGSKFSGVVLAQRANGSLSLTDMASGKTVLLTKLGDFGSLNPGLVSPDGRFLLDPGTGQIVSFARLAHPALVPNKLLFTPAGAGYTQAYWSDHDTSVVVLVYSNSPSPTFPAVAVQNVTTGATSALHGIDNAAGDPQQPGAFVSVPVPGPPPASAPPDDAAVELKDAGSPARLLATTATLVRAAGLKKGSLVSLDPVPNPQGTMVAVDVYGPGTMGGIVVLSRTGKVLATEQAVPGGLFDTVWSDSGRSLAFVDTGAQGLQLTRWEIGEQSVTTILNMSEKALGSCLWSPDGTSVLCQGAHLQWTLVRSGAANSTYVFGADGQPLAWLNGRLG
jgi:hypothetical protein